MESDRTHHIVMADEVLEGESGGKSGLERLSAGAHDAQKRQRVFRLLGLLLESILGCGSIGVSFLTSTPDADAETAGQSRQRRGMHDMAGLLWSGSFENPN